MEKASGIHPYKMPTFYPSKVLWLEKLLITFTSKRMENYNWFGMHWSQNIANWIFSGTHLTPKGVLITLQVKMPNLFMKVEEPKSLRIQNGQLTLNTMPMDRISTYIERSPEQFCISTFLHFWSLWHQWCHCICLMICIQHEWLCQ